MRSLLIIFIAGFPIAIILAWAFNLTPKGVEKHEQTIDETGEVKSEPLIGNQTELYIVSGLLLLAIGLFLFQGDVVSDSGNADASLATLAEPEPMSIAVLPFVPFSDDKQDEYFADGLSEELLNVLAKMQNLRVAARTSSFAYKGVNRNIQEVGRELGVKRILEGSVRRNDIDNTIRVTAQLIDVDTGAHLWSETYDRQFSDVFKIQDEITAAVVDQLKLTLLGDDRQEMLKHDTTSPEALVAHTMGREELAKRTSSSVTEAAKFFRKAINNDPTYSTAYASLSEAYSLMIIYANKPKDEYMALAQEAVDQALKLDEKSGTAWAAQGLIYMASKETSEQAMQALEKAIEFNPSYAMAYMWYGSLLSDPQERMKHHRKAFELDPKSAVAGYNLANDYVELGDDKTAMTVFSKIVEADPFYPGAYRLVGQISQTRGRVDQALVQFKKAYDLDPDAKTAINIGQMYVDLEDAKSAKLWLNKAKQLASEEYNNRIAWLGFFTEMLDDNLKQAYEALLPYRKSDSTDIYKRLNTVMVNYVMQDYPEAVRAYEEAEVVRQATDMEPPFLKFVDAYIAASYSYQQLEQHQKANEILVALNKAMDEFATKGYRISPELWYHKALVQALSGEVQMSLISLQRAIDEGWTQGQRLRLEPALDKLRKHELYLAMANGLDAKISLMREQLAFEESFDTNWSGS
jgi:TolB-like protein/Tfp pilus assembly protein PilF